MNEIQKLLQTGRVYQTDQGGAGGVMLPITAVQRLQQIGFEYEKMKQEKGDQKK